ncbi:hypothetical protein T265_00105 [Opisthorchis viverrini]|uniref:Galectin domain-containing protein n=1 Tax=Opisthorchis viverrini TaxID=6198 RepID=A0A075ADJ4_OPIVI|nr:hypothetical protein T265_00105 [Opisthorchis viverrini]KER34255.1 hypothetical protein T265_00105 [Opisthorchis viverrini]
MYDDYAFDHAPGGEEEYEGPIVQPIPDNLMVGDYIEINGICRGPEVIIELITEEQQRGMRNDILPLHVRLQAGGPVLVKNYSKDKVNRQEYNHRMGMQQNLAFELCIYALEEGYEIKLNGETVCMQKHVVRLEDVAAITMDGDADFTSIEFKDTSGEDAEGIYDVEEPQLGYMRVQEMRDSFSRKPATPIVVRSSVRRSKRSNEVASPMPIGKSEWKTSSDLSKPTIDIDTVSRAARDSTSAYMTHNAGVNASSDGYRTSTVDLSPKSKKRSTVLPTIGSRKSINLDESKLEEYAVVGGSQSRTIAGDSHGGAYRLLDDETMPVSRPSIQSLRGTSLSASAASLQEKKKKRGSIFGRFRKSKGSEPDLSAVETEKKKKGSRSLLRTKKGVTSVSANDVRMSASFTDMPTTASGSVFGQSSTMSLRPNYLGVGADLAPVPGPIPKSASKLSAPEMAAYVAGQKAVPEFEAFMLTNGVDPASYTHLNDERSLQTFSRPYPESHTMTAGPSQVAPIMRASEGPVYLNVGVDRASVPGPVPKSVAKAAAPEIAGYVAGQKAIPEFENFTIIGPVSAASVGSVMAYDQPTQRMSAAPTVPTTTRKLKGNAPENADILYDSGRASFDPNVNLTGGAPEPVPRGIESRYMENDLQRATKPPKLKGSAPQMASAVQSYYQNVAPGDSNLVDLKATDFRPTSGSVVAPLGPPQYSESKPAKLKGPAPELAAKLEDKYHGRMGHLPETTLAGDVSTQKPRSSMVQRPVYDVDNVISKPKYNMNPVIQKPVYQEPVRSASVPYPSYSRDEDTESAIHSDGEYVLTVGRSDYYYERKRSLRNYRSRRSRAKERETRASMGFPNRIDSAGSSISSLTESELMLCRKSRPFMSQQDFRERPVYSTRANMSKVYAEPPTIKSIPIPTTKSYVDATELRNNKFGAKFPLTLRSGRSALLTGHFLNELPIPQSCTIRLWTDEITEVDSFSAMTVEVWSTSSMTVYGTKNSNPTCLVSWKGADNSTNLDSHKNFAICIHARGLYSAVSINDYVTLKLPESFNPVLLNHLELESSKNAELDLFSVTDNLVLPIDLLFPKYSNRAETQMVLLKTQMTADTKCVTVTFSTQTNKLFTVVFDFEQYRISVQPAAEDGRPVSWKEIIFVPEQIREIEICRFTTENSLSVRANATEMLNQPLPLTCPAGDLSRIRINGPYSFPFSCLLSFRMACSHDLVSRMKHIHCAASTRFPAFDYI